MSTKRRNEKHPPTPCPVCGEVIRRLYEHLNQKHAEVKP
jgi:hypothetical protein